jgi:hypothetical protein
MIDDCFDGTDSMSDDLDPTSTQDLKTRKIYFHQIHETNFRATRVISHYIVNTPRHRDKSSAEGQFSEKMVTFMFKAGRFVGGIAFRVTFGGPAERTMRMDNCLQEAV